MFKQYNHLISQLHLLQTVRYIRIIWLSIDSVGEGKSSLSVVFNIKQVIIPLDLYYLMNKAKTGHPDSDKVQVIENITLKLNFSLRPPYTIKRNPIK